MERNKGNRTKRVWRGSKGDPRRGATAAVRTILKTKLLEQFKATPCEEQEESTRNASRKPRLY
jgi:hypothetical protein